MVFDSHKDGVVQEQSVAQESKQEAVNVQTEAQEQKNQQHISETDKADALSVASATFRLTIEGTEIEYISEYQFELSLTDIDTKDNGILIKVCDSFNDVAQNVKTAAAKSFNDGDPKFDEKGGILFLFSGPAPTEKQEQDLLTMFEDKYLIYQTTMALHQKAGFDQRKDGAFNMLGLQYRLVVKEVGWDGEKDTYKTIADKRYDAPKVRMKCLEYVPIN